MAKICKAIFFGKIKENEPTSVVSQEVLVSQSCPTLCNPMRSTGSSVHGILQARILEWFAMPFLYIYVCVCVYIYINIYIKEPSETFRNEKYSISYVGKKTA